MTTRAYSQSTVAAMRDDLREIDVRVLALEALKREEEALIRHFDIDIGDTDLRKLREDLKAAKRERKSLVRKLANIPPPGPSNIIVRTPNPLPFPKDVTKQ